MQHPNNALQAMEDPKSTKKVAKGQRNCSCCAGGLYVIGTERHESRRIDNQLRGRSGRQGDPGASSFFLSTQDDLMRIFSPEALENVLSSKAIGLKDGEALTHPWLSKALEKAQTRVEQQNYEIRKNLLKYDNVMNDQRKQIYEDRHEIMNAENITEMVTDMRHNLISEMVAKFIPENAYAEQWDVAGLKADAQAFLNLNLPIENWVKEEGIANEEIEDRLIKASDDLIAAKRARAGDKFFDHIEKSFALRLLDQNWKEHLLSLDHVRQGINLRAFAQRDPLNEYKSEAFSLFNIMTEKLRNMIVQNLSIVEINIDEQTFSQMEAQKRAEEERLAKLTRQDPALEGVAGADKESNPAIPFRKKFVQDDPSTWMGNVPRNANCPCGSGKKFKYCHGKIY
jgi:preprotein translocase subunit SecA